MVFNLSKALLFDFDGTFADTAHDLIGTANLIFKKYKKPLIKYEEGRSVASDGSKAFLKLRFDKEKCNFEKITQEFVECYRNNLHKNPILFDGIKNIIDLIEEKKLKWGIVTNKPREFTEKILCHNKLLDTIDVLICGDDGFNLKPDPDMLLEASRIMGLAPFDIAYVGDAERDICAAKAANMTAILACYGYLKSTDKIDTWLTDKIIQTPQELSVMI